MLKKITDIDYKVGLVFKNKVNLPNTKIGSIGFCFYDYTTGIQIIFDTGFYDGFNLSDKTYKNLSEAEYMLDLIGYSSMPYIFKNVIQLMNDFDNGLFHPVFNNDYVKFPQPPHDIENFFYNSNFNDYK